MFVVVVVAVVAVVRGRGVVVVGVWWVALGERGDVSVGRGVGVRLWLVGGGGAMGVVNCGVLRSGRP